jgi:4,5-epoxidase
METRSTEVLVVGAGPVGMTAALLLKKRGIAVEVIDTAPWPGTRSGSLGLHAASVRLLQQLGLSAAVEELGTPIKQVALYDRGERLCSASLGSVAMGWPVSIGQAQIEGLLEEALLKEGLGVWWCHRLHGLTQSDDAVVAEVAELEERETGYAVAHLEWGVRKTVQIRARFVIGADGHDSLCRRACSIGFPEVAPSQRYGVFEFHSSFANRNELRLIVDDGTLNGFWPLPSSLCRFSFATAPDSSWRGDRSKDRTIVQLAKDRTAAGLSEATLSSLLERRAPWFDGTIGGPRWHAVCRFDSRLAERFGSGRVWLAGDAAHLAAPLGMHSMNVGMLEANTLVERITDSLQSNEPAFSLERYEAERLTEWTWLHGRDEPAQAVTGTPAAVVAVKDQLRSALPASGDELMRLGLDLGVKL